MKFLKMRDNRGMEKKPTFDKYLKELVNHKKS